MPSAIIKLKIILKILKINFWPPLPGVWKIAKTHYKPKNENHHMGVFDSSNEAFWCTDYNAKNPSALRSPILEKIKKNRPKWPFFKNDHFFCAFSWFLKKWDLAESWGFLRCNQCIKTLHLSYQTPPYDDFNFLAYNGFLQFCRPLVAGVKRKNFILKKNIFSFLMA